MLFNKEKRRNQPEPAASDLHHVPQAMFSPTLLFNKLESESGKRELHRWGCFEFSKVPFLRPCIEGMMRLVCTAGNHLAGILCINSIGCLQHTPWSLSRSTCGNSYLPVWRAQAQAQCCHCQRCAKQFLTDHFLHCELWRLRMETSQALHSGTKMKMKIEIKIEIKKKRSTKLKKWKHRGTREGQKVKTKNPG